MLPRLCDREVNFFSLRFINILYQDSIARILLALKEITPGHTDKSPREDDTNAESPDESDTDDIPPNTPSNSGGVAAALETPEKSTNNAAEAAQILVDMNHSNTDWPATSRLETLIAIRRQH
jgi:hypothetical protein